MATFNETRVAVDILLRHLEDGTDRVFLVVKTFDEARGRMEMRTHRVDVTHLMSAARLSGIAALMDDAVTHVKQQLELPADVAVGWPVDPAD